MLEIAGPPLSQLVSTCSNVSNLLQRINASKRPQKILASLAFHTGVVCDFTQSLSATLPFMERAFADSISSADASNQRVSKTESAMKELRAIKRSAKHLVASCLRQMVEAISTSPGKYAEATSTSVHDIAYDSLRMILQVCESQSVCGPALRAIGSGNWMPNLDAPPILQVAVSTGDAAELQEESQLIAAYCNDLLATALTAIEARSKSIRLPTTSAIFLLK